jgi:hypothetical protein
LAAFQWTQRQGDIRARGRGICGPKHLAAVLGRCAAAGLKQVRLAKVSASLALPWHVTSYA